MVWLLAAAVPAMLLCSVLMRAAGRASRAEEALGLVPDVALGVAAPAPAKEDARHG